MEKEAKLTSLYLKTFSQKFDLNTIFQLDLSNQQITGIGDLPQCTNLVMLDLSNNKISLISGIGALVNIIHLNLAYNKLT